MDKYKVPNCVVCDGEYHIATMATTIISAPILGSGFGDISNMKDEVIKERTYLKCIECGCEATYKIDNHGRIVYEMEIRDM